MAHRLSVNARHVRLDAQARLVDDGYMRFYTGSQPATPQAAVSGTLLVSLRFANPSSGPAAGGGITYVLAPLPATANGNAGWFRVFEGDGTTSVWDGSVGTTGDSGTQINFPTIAFAAGADVGVSGYTVSDPE